MEHQQNHILNTRLKKQAQAGRKRILLYILFVLNFAAIVAIWWHGSGSFLERGAGTASVLIGIGRLFGLLAEFFILLELVLVGRIRFIEDAFAFDKMNVVHRWVGYGLLVFILGHPTLLILGYAPLDGYSLWNQFLDFIKHWEDVLNAFLALLLFVAVIVSSVRLVRKRVRYEAWYFIHFLSYAAVFLVFEHQINTADVSRGGPLKYWLALNFVIFGLIFIYRFLRPPFLYSRHKFFVEKIVKETHDIASVYITGRNLNNFKFQAGQYANLMFMSRGMWFTHPFSFSTPWNGKFLRFSIKASGDFTSKIKNIKPGTKVIIDGPVGMFTSAQSKKDKILFIAAGVGITPVRAMLEELHGADTVLLYSNKTVADIAFKPDLEKYAGRCHFFLTRHEGPNISGFETGRITAEKITGLVPDLFQRDIYVCGPAEMIGSTRKILSAMGINKKRIHFEKFSY